MDTSFTSEINALYQNYGGGSTIEYMFSKLTELYIENQSFIM